MRYLAINSVNKLLNQWIQTAFLPRGIIKELTIATQTLLLSCKHKHLEHLLIHFKTLG